ncbi:MAG: hypothetical protein FWC26_00405, partial [Fibromonadales bacterium]|nr:hypothetical protein [Fibromonadales bacterium]
METPTITTRIADLIRNPHSAMPSEAELSAQKKLPEIPEASTQSSHSVDFSPLAQKILEESGSHESQWDRN